MAKMIDSKVLASCQREYYNAGIKGAIKPPP